MKKIWKIILITLASLLVLVGLLLLGIRLFFRLPHGDYYDASEAAFVIPGISDGYIAQGIEYDAENELFLMTGYMNDGSPSPLYILSRGGDLIKSLALALPDGSVNTNHCGGLALLGDYLYIAGGGDGCVYRYNYHAVLACDDHSILTAEPEVLSTARSSDDYVGPAFVTAVGDYLIVGEFYREGNYNTPDSHLFTTATGETNRALAVAYHMESSELPEAPVAAFSLPNQVQGMAIADGRIYLSTSWGMSRSHILTYDIAVLSAAPEGTIDLLGASLPLYAFSSASLLTDREIPPMSEEMVVVDGRLYVACESASDKYIFGKFTGGKWCYATDVTFFAP